MKSYIKMKYEQFLMRLFDSVIKLLSKTRSYWYPKHILCYDLEEKIDDLEQKIDELEMANLRLYQENDELKEKLDFYEPFEGCTDEEP